MQRTNSIPHRSRPLLVLVATGSLALAGCSVNLGGSGSSADPATTAVPAPTAAEESPAAASATASDPDLPTAPGYAVGEIPPIPLFTLPDLGLLSESTGAFTPDLTSTVTSVPGITVAPARCDEAGVLDSGTTVVHGDGSVVTSSEDTSVVNDGQGAGVFTEGDVTIVNSGDGAGTYSSPTVSIVNNGDGTGTYTDSATGLSIVNLGDGTALVNSQVVDAEALPEVGEVGAFPPIDAAEPVTACGTVITLDSGVLFDFDSAVVRPEAQATLEDLASLLNEAGAPTAQVNGHTDSIADEAYNQTLSEQRAEAVVAALQAAGTTAELRAAGFGESQPVAPNENADGSDNPAGRQLNRRVEIFVPAF